MIHCQLVGIFGSSETMFSQDYYNWTGKGDICFKSKGKKKVTFSGRDLGVNSDFDGESVITADGIFTGTGNLPSDRPAPDARLTPLRCENRTIIG